MPDHASSADPGVQRQLDRLMALGPGADVLGLDRITRLLDRIGNPHRALPPVFHVAGTNGKGSTCAFLRAALEADGRRVHVYTSPHLVRFNERIRLAGRLIEDDALAALLAEVLDAGGDIGASFFEVTTAAAFLAFHRTPADACVIEVGLGGRLDATNVLTDPAVCGIAQLGMDHESFLGDTIEKIAFEKAGIAKPGRPLVTIDHGDALNAVIAAHCRSVGAPLLRQGVDWQFGGDTHQNTVVHHGPGGGAQVATPWPALPGDHQVGNLALAIAMLRAQDRVPVSAAALQAAPLAVRWPARMQRLGDGPLSAMLAPGSSIWLDGGHNPAAGQAVADALASLVPDGGVHLILGMLANKQPEGLLAPIAPMLASVTAIPVPGHAHHAPDALVGTLAQMGVADGQVAADPADAVARLARRLNGQAAPVLILGSLYLAGEVLRLNAELPD
ncbi:bifunctional folylpolyglutamate synthase/dihydrofolate synthase [Sphingomonas sp. BGYR3]|uniref:bifunctional folylpolyglutamate synthase/dihydrofolate synthase n=1 Tax=Sphingomonas sp. BGYR3 TaxID=2975483 RepID=UPI0021A893BE|nr:folylpolyglutamate synthase/dihydrofolate synthase family protein [Sphingomonas sp. BGYR3]MDG5487428.1 bifunctional folylpolyglutamate synthase/dihydrofolate synthase [Sphingomonas sp. BGYR3]